MNIYVGNLATDVTEEDLTNLFSQYGQVKEAKIIRDMFSQESRGFGFVEMPGQTDAQNAIKELNTQNLKGKNLVVNEARPKRDRDSRGGGGRRPGGGGGGGRGFSRGGGGGRGR
ncbi:MAG: RNA-binding protein [Ignavibacteria bacterium RBG_16_34_14]|nr:MAG: RNA-binding protein [Ignavibacteria bacterium RBG_16_34_14]